MILSRNNQELENKWIMKTWSFYIKTEWSSGWLPGGHLNIKMSSYQYRDPMFKIRRCRDRLIFNMGIPVPGRDDLYIETWALVINGDVEGKLQHLQWRPGPSPWWPSRFSVSGFYLHCLLKGSGSGGTYMMCLTLSLSTWTSAGLWQKWRNQRKMYLSTYWGQQEIAG